MTEQQERDDTMSYEALYQELMRKPIPREGVAVAKRALDRLRQGDEEVDAYERWLTSLQNR